MMLNKCAVFVFILVYNNCGGIPTEIMCPDYCVCDIWKNLRRATCHNRKLYSIEIDMPSQVQILDMSNNQVSELGGNIFLETSLTNLKLLNLSHNKVSQIHLNGFEGLEKLKTLDLSFNAVQYFNDQWFISLGSLQELYLRGNNLMSINDEPKIRLLHLKVLDISLCKIEHLRHGTLRHLPNLESLDVSDNLLTTLHVDVIRPLKNLLTLLANKNPLRCENGMVTRVRNYTQIIGIHYEDSCGSHLNRSNNIEKFQRMVIEKPAISRNNSWIYDKEEIKVVEKIVCKENGTENSTRNIVDEYLMRIIDLSPSLVFLVTLICGINIGLLFGCICQYNGNSTAKAVIADETYSTPMRVFQRQNSIATIYSRARTRSGGSRKMMKEDRSVLLSNESHLYDSTPILTRKALV